MEGLGSAETVFSDYRTVNGIQVPYKVVSRFGGVVTQELTYSAFVFNIHTARTLFDRPREAEIGPEVGGSSAPITLTRVGKDVYFVSAVDTGGIFFYSSLVAIFREYVLVVDSPVSDGVSRAVIARIREMAPDKPIKYLIATHYHIDHIAGVREYLAAGTTVVTTPGNVDFFRRLTTVAHPLSSSPVSYPAPLPVESFQGKRVFADETQAVEIYNVGPTPHVDEMVVAYVPHDKLMFVSDLFPVNYKGRLRPADPTTVFFAQTLRLLGVEVQTIASGHGRLGTPEELQGAASLGATRQ
jgi:glyoxylase-like metal-dependent hydrolase (beta-lactamase superfamily II)